MDVATFTRNTNKEARKMSKIIQNAQQTGATHRKSSCTISRLKGVGKRLERLQVRKLVKVTKTKTKKFTKTKLQKITKAKL